MEETNPQLTRILSASSLLLVLLVGGYVLYDQPFQSERTASGFTSSLLENRLWEDPLKPIITIRAREEQILLNNPATNLDSFYEQYTDDQYEFAFRYLEGKSNDEVMIIGVTVPSSRFTLSSELRRRIRYSVLSALNQTHVPSNSEALSILRLLDFEASVQNKSDDSNLVYSSSNAPEIRGNHSAEIPLISYEVYKPYKTRDGRFDNQHSIPFLGKTILLLWIPEDLLQDSMLGRYAKILESLYAVESRVPESVLIGPTSSNGLVSLYNEIDLTNLQSNFVTTLSEEVASRLLNLQLPTSLNTTVTNLLMDIYNSQDDRKPESIQLAILDCYAGKVPQERRSLESAENCLQQLDLPIRYQYLDNFVSSTWPPQLESELLRGLDSNIQKQVSDLIERVDSYLDFGLSESKQTDLVNCFITTPGVPQFLSQENVTDCLRKLEIADSNVTWYDYIGESFPSDSLISALPSVPLSNPAAVIQLINSANNYLDNGLDTEGQKKLIECFDASQNIVELNRDNVKVCLSTLATTDSDENWITTLANYWPDPSLPYGINRLPLPIRASVAELIDSADWYLDFGLEDSKRIELVGCFGSNRTISELNRQNVTQCLRSLGIEDSDNYWYDYVASDWPAAKTINQIVVVSPRATISPKALRLEVGKVVRDQGFQIVRSITSDEKLLQAIYDELEYRQLTPAETRLALIYESDGKYGRALESELRCNTSEQDTGCFPSEHVDSYGYLRGIDGLLSNESSASSSAPESTTKSVESLLHSSNALEEPLGQHQYDYLRRLAIQVSQKKYDAIGVLGTDIFDKLLVLQALRERNPNSVFFTTDLDSFIGQGTQRAWSQNLLVASAFALVGPDNTGNSCNQVDDSNSSQVGISVPPFRDSYQTSYFYATCLALHIAENKRQEFKKLIEDKLATKVFLYEIGRNDAVLLSNRDSGPGELASQFRDENLIRNSNFFISWAVIMAPMIIITLASLAGLISRRPRVFTLPNTFYFALYLSLGAFMGVLITQNIETSLGTSQLPLDVWKILNLMLYAVSTLLLLIVSINMGSRGQFRLLRLDYDTALFNCLFLCLAILVTMCTLLITEIYSPGGEPVRPFSGVSHWPTTLIRLQILATSICFALYAYAKWNASNESIAVLIPRCIDDRNLQATAGWSISGWLGQINRENESRQQSASIEVLWQRYRTLGTGWKRLARVLIKTIILTALLLATYHWLTPQPALIRGSYPIANFLFGDSFATIVAFTAMFMIIVGNDVTRLCRAFIRALRKYEVDLTNFDPDKVMTQNYDDPDVNKSIAVLEIIAKRTEAITPLVFFPFLIIFLMIASRSTLFEGWEWSLELVIVYGLISAYVLYSAIMLQREASLARKQVLIALEAIPRIKEIWNLDESTRKKLEIQLLAARDHVINLNRGAFVAWYRHPLFQSLALPTSGTSGLFLLQYLS